MKRGKLYIGVLLVFVLGFLAGAFTIRLIGPPHPPFDRQSAEERVDKIVSHISGELRLDPKQNQQVRKIIQDVDVDINNHLMQERKHVKSIVEKGMSEINQLLEPNQKERFKRMKEEFDKRQPKGGPHFPPPPNGFFKENHKEDK